MLHSMKSKSEIVCFVTLTDKGIKIHYHCHMLYERPVAGGPWGRPIPTWHAINPKLSALIESSIAEALWEVAKGDETEIVQIPVDQQQSPDLTEMLQ